MEEVFSFVASYTMHYTIDRHIYIIIAKRVKLKKLNKINLIFYFETFCDTIGKTNHCLHYRLFVSIAYYLSNSKDLLKDPNWSRPTKFFKQLRPSCIKRCRKKGWKQKQQTKTLTSIIIKWWRERERKTHRFECSKNMYKPYNQVFV